MKNPFLARRLPEILMRSERPLPGRQGASEHQNFGVKPTLPKTDSSCCFGIPEHKLGRKKCNTYKGKLIGWDQNWSVFDMAQGKSQTRSNRYENLNFLQLACI